MVVLQGNNGGQRIIVKIESEIRGENTSISSSNIVIINITNTLMRDSSCAIDLTSWTRDTAILIGSPVATRCTSDTLFSVEYLASRIYFNYSLTNITYTFLKNSVNTSWTPLTSISNCSTLDSVNGTTSTTHLLTYSQRVTMNIVS